MSDSTDAVPMPPRHPEFVLDEAARLTSQDRQGTYDHPRRNLTQTAALWSAYLSRKLSAPLDARDVAWMMVMVKASRDSYSRKRDNLVDGAGWLRCAEMAEEGRDPRIVADVVLIGMDAAAGRKP